MNSLYHIAIIEGFLAQHSHLPRNVQEAIEFLKQVTAPKASEQTASKKKKRKMSPEQKERMTVHLANMRAARGIIALSAEQREQILALRKQGKSRPEIVEATGHSLSRIDTVLYTK